MDRNAESLVEVEPAVCIAPTVVGKSRLIVRELDARLTDCLGKVLNPCAPNQSDLAFNDQSEAHHHNKGGKGNEEMNLQAGNNGHERHNDPN